MLATATLDPHEQSNIRMKYRVLLNLLIAFDADAGHKVLATEIAAATDHVEQLKRLDKLIKDAPEEARDAASGRLSRMLRWLANKGDAKTRAEAQAILALETSHRPSEIG